MHCPWVALPVPAPHAGIDAKGVGLDGEQDGCEDEHGPPDAKAAAAGQLAVGALEEGDQHHKLQHAGGCRGSGREGHNLTTGMRGSCHLLQSAAEVCRKPAETGSSRRMPPGAVHLCEAGPHLRK